MNALNEMSFGVLDGQLRGGLDHKQQQLLDQWTKDKVRFRVPNGECLMDVQRRVAPALSSMLEDMADGTLLIVGHRHTNLVILSALLRCDLHAIADSPIQSKYVYEIQYSPTPHIHTICLTGKARGKRIEGFLSGDDAMRTSEEHCPKS
jgi:broad specificity phosphatase PhoE